MRTITVNPGQVSTALGQPIHFTATASYSNGNSKDVTDAVTWTTSEPSVAAPGTGGVINPKAVGQTNVVASIYGRTGAAALTVTPAPLTGIAVSTPSAAISAGLTAQLKATGTYADNSSSDLTSQVSWTVAQPSIAAVNASGLAVAKSPGNTQVSASFSGLNATGTIIVGPPALKGLGVASKETVLALGATLQMAATGSYTDGSTADLTAQASWVSSAPATVAIGAPGLVKAAGIGAAAVSASLAGFTGSADLTVSPATLSAIAVTAAQTSMPLGATQQLTAVGTYSDSSTRDLTANVAWVSSSPGVIAINGPGAIFAKGLGAAVITASLSGITGGANLSVTSAALSSIAIHASRLSLPAGIAGQLTATGTYTDGTTQDVTASATWRSSSPAILAVSGTGSMTGISEGVSAISATVAKVSDSANISVTPAELVSIAIGGTDSALPLGETLQLTATGTFTDGKTQDITQTTVWSSSSPDVVDVRSPGLVAAVATGTAAVTATSGEISGLGSLTVSEPALSALVIGPAGPTVPIGGALQLTVTGNLSDGSTKDVTAQVAWTVDSNTIAHVETGGLATGLQIGTTSIHASLNGIDTMDTLTVLPALTVAYYDVTSGGDSTIRVTNPGLTGRDLCTMIYVYDQDQQMSECCGCLVSQDGLLTLSLHDNLLSNPLTGVPSVAGTVVLVPAQAALNGSCNAASVTPAGTVIGWSTRLPGSEKSFGLATDEPFSYSPLTDTNAAALQAQCSFVQQLGSGHGICGCGSNQY